MAFAGKVLAEGQLPNSKGTLYTVGVGVTAYVKFFSCFNTNTTSETVVVYSNPSGTSRIMGRAVLAQNEQVRFIDKDDGLTLSAGSLIEGYTTTAAKVDYIITGIEES